MPCEMELKTGIKLARLFIRRSSEIHIPSDDHMELVVDIVEGKTCCGTCVYFSHLDGRCFFGVEKPHLLMDGCCEWIPADTED